MVSPALPFTRSISNQIWRWRNGASSIDEIDQSNTNLVATLLRARGCAPDDIPAYQSPTIRAFMPDPSVFADMERAAERLADAVEAHETVTVFGDYDVDGATSAAVLIRLLDDLGLKASAYIPDRLMEGYGPSGAALVGLAKAGSSLVVTVDCGAQAFEALEMASAAKLDVIIVDHHQCATALPNAYAIVNPNRLDESAEGAAHGHLAAVGMAFLLGAALVRSLRARAFFASRTEPQLLDLLDIVALGTVADVAPLKGLNRALVAQGLKVMAARKNIGLNALIEAAQLTRAPTCADLGFALGPRINAGGRVGKSDLGVRLLTTIDADEAKAIAQELNALNTERRIIEADVQAETEALARGQDNRAVIVVAGRGWHPGVIGIVAGRLKEKFGRPAFVIALDGDGFGKGSGRSIPGVDLGAAVLAARDSGLLVAGGGHKMAAGLTVTCSAIDALIDFLEARLANDVALATADRALLVDLVVAPGGVTPELVTELELAGPYGMGWPAPRIVVGTARVIKADVVGTEHVRVILGGDDGRSLKAIAFRQADTLLGQMLLAAPNDRRIWVAGRPKCDNWGGRHQAELHIEDAAWSE